MAVQTRPIWNVSEGEAGAVGDFDPASLQVTRKALAGIKFGVFFVNGSGGWTNISSTSDHVSGISLIDNQASDYANRTYTTNELVAGLRRGYAWVKIDTANKPSAYGAVKISYATGKLGYLTTDTVESREIGDNQGVEIVQVLDTVALVYLSGNPKMAISAAEVAS